MKYSYEEKVRRRLFQQMVHLWQGMKVLDVGAGVGNWCFWYEVSGCQVTGIDFSEEMVSLAQEQALERGSKVQFFRRAIEDWEGSQEEFDVITAITVLQHIIDEGCFERAVANMARLVKKGGHIVVCEAVGHEDRLEGKYLRIRPQERYHFYFGRQGCRLVEGKGVRYQAYLIYDLYMRLRRSIVSTLKKEAPPSLLPVTSERWKRMGGGNGRVGNLLLRLSGAVDRLIGHLPWVKKRFCKVTMMLFERTL
ncbi:MAG: class I SAM-dependent methyltransferase [Chloroflexi bacterium]|nr:class I SAM-dependent methyltransferase [Chloroflexota bacterium]